MIYTKVEKRLLNRDKNAERVAAQTEDIIDMMLLVVKAAEFTFFIICCRKHWNAKYYLFWSQRNVAPACIEREQINRMGVFFSSKNFCCKGSDFKTPAYISTTEARVYLHYMLAYMLAEKQYLQTDGFRARGTVSWLIEMQS